MTIVLSELEKKILAQCAGRVVSGGLPYNAEQRAAQQRLAREGLIYHTMEDDQPTAYTTDRGEAILREIEGG